MAPIGQKVAKLLCKIGWHGKTEDRTLWQTPYVRLSADHCSRCGHCYVEVTPQMRALFVDHWPK